MRGLNVCTFVLVVVSCYALSNSKAVQHDEQQLRQQQHQLQTAHKLTMPNRSSHAGAESAYLRAQQGAPGTPDEARQKREYKELNDVIDELEENSYAQKAAAQLTQVTQPPQGLDLDNMPALTYYLLLQKLRQLQSGEPTYRVRTPRLGRSIDFQQLLDATGSDGRHMGYATGGDDDEDRFGGGSGAIDIAALGVGSGTGSGSGSGSGPGFSPGMGSGLGVARQFVSRIMKKSVPFKPRLGKRAQVCSNGSGSGSGNGGGGGD